MKQTVITIYAVVLCGFCTIAFSGYTGTAIYQFIRYSAPKKFICTSETVRLSTNDLFWQSLEEGRSILATKGRPTEAELTLRREARLNEVVSELKTSAFSQTIQNSILAMIFGIIGLAHLVLYRRIPRSAS